MLIDNEAKRRLEMREERKVAKEVSFKFNSIWFNERPQRQQLIPFRLNNICAAIFRGVFGQHRAMYDKQSHPRRTVKQSRRDTRHRLINFALKFFFCFSEFKPAARRTIPDVSELSNLHVLAAINTRFSPPLAEQKRTLSLHDVSCIECLTKLIIYDSNFYLARSLFCNAFQCLIMQNEKEKSGRPHSMGSAWELFKLN